MTFKVSLYKTVRIFGNDLIAIKVMVKNHRTEFYPPRPDRLKRQHRVVD